MIIQLYKLILTIICLSFPILAIAIPSAAVVDAVQERAAFQREGRQKPLAKGIELYAGDIITTGAKARVVIRLADRSLVRIGAHAQVKFEQLNSPVSKSEILTAVFNVLKGVFRFTGSHDNPLDVKIRVGNSISAGIRGTDVYTHAQADKDIVCLIAGQVSIQAGEVKAMLTQPREGFIVPKGSPPLPISLISEEKFQQWLKNSEISKP
jgi:hypothetical protein